MSLYEVCERCDKREHSWHVREWSIQVGEVNRKPHLCEGCTKQVETALLAVLQRRQPSEPPR